MKIDTITDRLIQQADIELKERIKEAAKPLEDLLRNGVSGVDIPIMRRHHSDEESEIGRAAWYEMMEALRRDAFDKRCTENRQSKIDKFMSKVTKLGSEIDELRDSIGRS